MSIYDKSSLVLIPSGTKTGKVYSQKPVSGDGDFTFTRASAATRVNADGNIEKETQNLLLQSNSFDTTWATSSSSVTAGQSGYDGTNNAWQLTATNTSNAYVRQSLSFNSVQTLSVYAKANTADFIELVTIGGGGANPRSWFNLATGSVGTSYNCIDTKIEAVSGGWYRCSITLNASITGYRIYVMDGDNSTAVTNGNSIYIQDAQLNQGLIAQEVITTTTAAVYGGITDNTPRLDYTDSSCPSLKLEPQRTNLVPFSEHLESSDWSKTRCTIEDNSTTSPEGVINASKMTSTDASESYIQDNLTTTGTKLTWSFFAKKGDLDYAHGLVWDLSANGCRQWFNLSTGAVGGTTTFGSGYSVDSATIEDYGNGWYRCAMVVNSTAGGQGCRVNISSADTTIGSAVNSYGYFYGLQLEAGSYATSYIPTYGSSVTRVADVSCETETPNTSLFGQTEGTIFCEYTPVSDDTTNQSRFIRLRNSSSSNQVYMQHNVLNNVNAVVFNGSNQFVGQTPTGYVSVGNTYKFALGYKNGDYVFYANGVQIDTGTATGLGTLAIDRLSLDNANIGKSSKVNQALVFKTRLTNAELAALTTI